MYIIIEGKRDAISLLCFHTYLVSPYFIIHYLFCLVKYGFCLLVRMTLVRVLELQF